MYLILRMNYSNKMIIGKHKFLYENMFTQQVKRGQVQQKNAGE